jgi:hypothetical protein
MVAMIIGTAGHDMIPGMPSITIINPKKLGRAAVIITGIWV